MRTFVYSLLLATATFIEPLQAQKHYDTHLIRELLSSPVLIGSELTGELEAAIRTTISPVRIQLVNSAWTMDYVHSRLNIAIDENRIIKAIWWG